MHAFRSAKTVPFCCPQGATRPILFLIYPRNSKPAAGLDQIYMRSRTPGHAMNAAGIRARHGDAINMRLPEIC
jgi:hypothetical protein